MTSVLDIDHIAVINLWTNIITRFLYALPITQRRIFVRRYWYFESINEIASTFSISESKVKSMLMRLRKKLKQHLEQEGFEL